MTTLITPSGQPFQPPAGTSVQPRLFAAILADGCTMIAEERGALWYHPVKLEAAGPMPMLQVFANAEAIPAQKDKVLHFTYDLHPAAKSLYESVKAGVRKHRAGLV